MLFRLLTLIISCLVLAMINVGRACARLLGRSLAPRCAVLYYHSVPPQGRHSFAAQMDMVLRFSTPVGLDSLALLQPGQRYTAITFDDAFADAVENAVPELMSRRIPARFFVTTGVLGRTAEWWPTDSPEYHRQIATAEQLRNLPQDLVSIGSHTVTHPHLSTLAEQVARYELAESKRQLETVLGRSVDTISYPYGSFSRDVVRMSQVAGYAHAFTTIHSFAPPPRNSYLIGRFKVEPSDWTIEFFVKMLGGYVWYPSAVAAKRRLRGLISAARPHRLLSTSQPRHS